jgi:serine/threonine-protein kinase ULK/ATG1
MTSPITISNLPSSPPQSPQVSSPLRSCVCGVYKKSHGKLIGSGQYGQVYNGENVHTGERVAIKEIIWKKWLTKTGFSNLTIEHVQAMVRKEIDCQNACGHPDPHPNVVYLHAWDINSKYGYLVMELCDSNLLTLMNEFKESGKPMDESQAQRIFRQIVNGLHALRVRNIVHRDLKPANFLLKTIPGQAAAESDGSGKMSRDTQVKIADFGFARQVKSEDLAQTICGSPMYMAPEVVTKGYDDKVRIIPSHMLLLDKLILHRLTFGASASCCTKCFLMLHLFMAEAR